MTCPLCGSLTQQLHQVGFRWDDGGLTGPYGVCSDCRTTLSWLPPRGMRLVNPDGSPLSTPRGALDPSPELPAGGRAVPAADHPPG